MTSALFILACTAPAALDSASGTLSTTTTTTATTTTTTTTTGTSTTTTTTGTSTGTPFTPPEVAPTNLLMISVDTLRKDHLGRYDAQGRGLTPFLDSVMAAGVVFDEHTSCSNWTLGSVACALTGRQNVDMNWMAYLDDRGTKLPWPAQTVAELMADAGRFTILKTTNPWFSKDWAMDEGFEESDLLWGATLEEAAADAVTTLREAKAEGLADAWYVHVHAFEPHAPYGPPESYLKGLEALPPVEWDLADGTAHYAMLAGWNGYTDEERALLEQHMRLRYEGEVRWLDDQLRAVWERLEVEGLLQDTLVVLWSDHGEQFFEHGDQTHAYTLHVEENEAFAAFWWQGAVPAAVPFATDHTDLLPTALDILQVAAPAEVTGQSVYDVDGSRPRFATAVARSGPVQTVTLDGVKLHYTWRGGVKELYRHETDPRELTNVYGVADPDVIALWELLLPEVDRANTVIDGNIRPENPGP